MISVIPSKTTFYRSCKLRQRYFYWCLIMCDIKWAINVSICVRDWIILCSEKISENRRKKHQQKEACSCLFTFLTCFILKINPLYGLARTAIFISSLTAQVSYNGFVYDCVCVCIFEWPVDSNSYRYLLSSVLFWILKYNKQHVTSK